MEVLAAIGAVGWPVAMAVVIIVLGLTVLLLFKRPIAVKIERLTAAGRDGVKFTPPDQLPADTPAPEGLGGGLGADGGKSAAEEAPGDGTQRQTFDDLMGGPIYASTLERERLVKSRLDGLELDTPQTVALLTRAISIANVELEFTRAAYILWGSQIDMMVATVGRTSALPRAAAQGFFDSAKERFPELHRDRTFDQWIRYMVDNQLVVVNDEGVDITQTGKDFLKYLVDARLAYERYG